MDLYISSGYHITRPQKRVDAIEERFENVDVVFAEAPLADNPPLRSILLNFVAAPLLMSVMYSWVSILYISNRVFSSSDAEVIDYLNQVHNSEYVQTDINMNRLIGKRRILWFISHFCLVLVSALAVPGFISEAQTESTLLALVTLLTLAGVAVFLTLLAAVDQVRNQTIANDILQYAKENPNSQAVLVVGGDHKNPIVDFLNKKSEVTVVNPD